MKQLTCEMCGSNDLIKQDGVFVCQSCGCKYSVEEAKKMMVEGTVEVTGTVKVDDEKETLNLKQLVSNAKNRKDYKEAAKYYNELLLKEPNSWEANYYTVYAQAMDIKVGEIPKELARVSNNIAPVFDLITKNNYTAEEKAGIMDEIGTSFFYLIMLYFDNTSAKDISVTTMLIEAQENFYRQFCNSFANDENFMKSYGLSLLNKKIKGEYIYILSDLPMYKFMVEYRNILGKEVVKNTNLICEQILKAYNSNSEDVNFAESQSKPSPQKYGKEVTMEQEKLLEEYKQKEKNIKDLSSSLVIIYIIGLLALLGGIVFKAPLLLICGAALFLIGFYCSSVLNNIKSS